MNILNIIKLKIYSNHIKPYKYSIYLNNNEISNLCVYTQYNKHEIIKMEKLFCKYQVKGLINENCFIHIICIPCKTNFYKNLLLYLDINDNIDIIKFILISSILFNKAKFITKEKIIILKILLFYNIFFKIYYKIILYIYI